MKRILIVLIGSVSLVIILALFHRGRNRSSIAAFPAANQYHPGTASAVAMDSAERLARLRPLHPAQPGTNQLVGRTNLLTRLLNGEEPPKISWDEAEVFANANGRQPAALLAAWRASGDKAFLREAMEKFPGDPHVAFMAWAQGGGVEGSSAEREAGRAEWLKRFQSAAPDNALADYLAA